MTMADEVAKMLMLAEASAEKRNVAVKVICNEVMLDRMIEELQAMRRGEKNSYNLEWHEGHPGGGRVSVAIMSLQPLHFIVQPAGEVGSGGSSGSNRPS